MPGALACSIRTNQGYDGKRQFCRSRFRLFEFPRHRRAADAWRVVVPVLLLVSHLMATLGFPLTVAPPKSATSSIPFPCATRPCGCRTSEECWAGDCCCFTLTEKLAWAEENGFDPPEHVRPLVAAQANQKSKDDEKEECPLCKAERLKNMAAAETAPPVVQIKFVLGAFTKKCRGETPEEAANAALLLVFPEGIATRFEVARAVFARPASVCVPTNISKPDSPPPKSC